MKSPVRRKVDLYVFWIKTFLRVNSRVLFYNANNLSSLSMKVLGCPVSNIPIALNDYSLFLKTTRTKFRCRNKLFISK
jgi:hypothetical protein